MTSSATAPRGVRIYRSLRTAHLERALDMTPADVLYRDTRYDFDAELSRRVQPRRCSDLACAALVVRARYAWVEINEPAGLEGVRRAAVVTLAVRVADLARGTRTPIVTYAIGTTDPFLLPRPSRLKARLGRTLDEVLARALWRRVDRVAFGTDSARHTYAEAFGAPSPRCAVTLIPAVPARCACLESTEVVRERAAAGPPVLLFVGDLAPRKGFDVLVDAWSRVRERDRLVHLVIVGTGKMHDVARDLARSDSRVTFCEDPPRGEVHARLRSATALVLLSQPSPLWREQVGLPIAEGLAHGCTVVTTDQTGLASWLSAAGHIVLSLPATLDDVADALVGAVSHPLDPRRVLASLPPHDGRIAADAWLAGRPGQGGPVPRP